MVVTTVIVQVKPEHVSDFMRAAAMNHEASVKEPGNLRFDILQSEDDSSRFMLYEAYTSEDAAAAHKETDHYTVWRDTVADWMAEPRRGIKYKAIRP